MSAVPELVSAAGGREVLGASGAHSPWTSFEELAGADPDAIMLLSCGFDLDRTHREMPPLTERAGRPAGRGGK